MSPLEFAVAPPPGLLRASVGPLLLVSILLASFGWVAYRRKGRIGYQKWFVPATALLLIVVHGVTEVLNYRGAPVAYVLDDSSLTVRSRTGQERFELETFQTAAPDSELRWHNAYGGRGSSCQMQGRRNWGAWGGFGVTKPPGLPWVHLHLTDRGRVVALEGRVNLLVSPRDTEAFIREARKRLSRAPSPN